MADTLQNKQSDEISLKDVLVGLQGWYSYLLKKWLIIVIVGLAGAALGLTYALTKKTNYVAELTFVLEDGKTNPLSAYMGLASQFGIDLGGGGNTGVFQGDNIMEFLKSRLMVERTLLSPVNFEGKDISLADLYIRFNKLDEAWEKDPGLKGLHFPVGLDRSKFTLKQDSVLNIIQGSIVKKSLDIGKIDKKLSFISVKCTSENELFSKRFTERLVKEATEFYVNTKIGRSKVNVDKLQQSADSLEMLLNRKTYSLAAAQDINQNPARQVATVSTELQQRDKMVLQTMYAEVIKNLELSKMAMAQETPVVQVVDTPILPLKKERFGKLKGLIVGGVLAGFLIVGILIARRAVSEIMAKEQ
jgi:hypothetical protein